MCALLAAAACLLHFYAAPQFLLVLPFLEAPDFRLALFSVRILLVQRWRQHRRQRQQRR